GPKGAGLLERRPGRSSSRRRQHLRRRRPPPSPNFQPSISRSQMALREPGGGALTQPRPRGPLRNPRGRRNGFDRYGYRSDNLALERPHRMLIPRFWNTARRPVVAPTTSAEGELGQIEMVGLANGEKHDVGAAIVDRRSTIGNNHLARKRECHSR